MRPNRHLQNTNPTTEEYTFFLSVLGTFSKVNHVLGHKISSNKFFEKIKILKAYSQNAVEWN